VSYIKENKFFHHVIYENSYENMILQNTWLKQCGGDAAGNVTQFVVDGCPNGGCDGPKEIQMQDKVCFSTFYFIR
jgi:hypothetical protein